MSSVPVAQFPTREDVINFYNSIKSPLNQYPPIEITRWLKQDIDYLKNHPEIEQNGIQKIKTQNNIEHFDLVLIDGSEFTGRAELEEVYGANIIILDDITTYKNYYSHQKLLQDSQYILVRQNSKLRNGYSIFRKIDFPPLPIELPIHFFTIVLNGQPFIRHHIEVFKQLPFEWHWHIIEGVADLKHDTAWSRQNGGKITDDLHHHGLSKDGTTEYIDELAKNYPNRIKVYRKPKNQFWDGKKEMVNAPLVNIKQECLLWQIDVDELWTAAQIVTARSLFTQYPDKTAAFYWCWYFVGYNLVISSRNCYSQNPNQEWLRTWKFKPGYEWDAHEPPILVEKTLKSKQNIAKLNPFFHEETEKYGLVFQHLAYFIEEQIAFKEKYYGYRNAVAQWLRLQQVTEFPVLLRDYFAWVKDKTIVDTAESLGIIPIVNRNPVTGEYNFLSHDSGHRLENSSIDVKPTIVFDAVIFQLNPHGGIARVWSSLLKEWSNNGFAKHIVVVDRNGTAPRVNGCRYIVIDDYDATSNRLNDKTILQSICNKYNADLFISSYYTSPIHTPSVMMVYDMIPEMFDTSLEDRQWLEKQATINTSFRFIAISESTANDLSLFYRNVSRDMISVVYPSVDKKSFYPASEIDIKIFKKKYNIEKPYFLLVGDRVGFRGYKNAKYFFNGLQKLSNNHDFAVVCVGGRPSLEQEILPFTYGLDIHLHNLDDDDLRCAYSGAVCLAYVSLYEGFGLPVLEAMSCGCPVVTCDNSSLVEVAGEAALYVDGYDELVLADALQKMLNPDFRNALVKAGIVQSDRFSWERAAEQVKEILLASYTQVPKNVKVLNYNNVDIDTQSEITSLKAKIKDMEGQISLMKRSKFWKARTKWVAFKRWLLHLSS